MAKKRKLIGLITAIPESVHSSRSIQGILCQCRKYDYDVAVFSPLSHVCNFRDDYLKGELNIYELINFDMLDAVIVDTMPLTEDNVTYVTRRIGERLEQDCSVPVQVLNIGVGDYPLVTNNDNDLFHEIVNHVLDVHQCRNIYFLTGTKGFLIAEERLAACVAAMHAHGLEVREEQIFYGDFWYTSGAKLAEQVASGEVPMPEAVICASDHMALGLVNGLKERGIRVPEDVIVTGFEATQEAALNDTSVTSLESNAVKTAADAVDRIRMILEPEAEILPFDAIHYNHIHTAMSCGCKPDYTHSALDFKSSIYSLYRDYTGSDPFENIDIGLLMEGYMPEILMGTDTIEKCLEQIYMKTYFLRPYSRFYLCLTERWNDTDLVLINGYPEHMKLCVVSTPNEGTGFYEEKKSVVFDTKLMLPALSEERSEPGVFYFAPVHFQEKTLGYAVLEKTLEQKKINLVFRNWLRFVSTSLEMIKTKTRLLELSIHDKMTGAYNRWGMDMKMEQMLASAQPGESLFVCVIDMNDLKYINDTFGHNEGDYGIKLVYTAAAAITSMEEICIRAGGDEFYIVGVGRYSEGDITDKVSVFNEFLAHNAQIQKKPYVVTASLGYALEPVAADMNVNDVISRADELMYRNKAEYKKHRKL